MMKHIGLGFILAALILLGYAIIYFLAVAFPLYVSLPLTALIFFAVGFCFSVLMDCVSDDFNGED